MDLQEVTGTGRSEYKVPGGKLLRARAVEEDGVITFLQVTGDFFLLPETDLEDLETELTGGTSDHESVRAKVKEFFEERNTVIAGASPEDFAKVILEALEG